MIAILMTAGVVPLAMPGPGDAPRLLGLTAIGWLKTSVALALFQQAYIWVHMYCTEAPDLRHMHP